MSHKLETIFSTHIFDYNKQIYSIYKLKAPTKAQLVSSMKHSNLQLRPRFLTTDKVGRLFNSIPIAISGDNILFSLPYNAEDSENFWWPPRGLDPIKYTNIPRDLMSQTTLQEGGTDEMINFKDDPYGRKIFMAVNVYPFGGLQNPKQR